MHNLQDGESKGLQAQGKQHHWQVYSRCRVRAPACCCDAAHFLAADAMVAEQACHPCNAASNAQRRVHTAACVCFAVNCCCYCCCHWIACTAQFTCMYAGSPQFCHCQSLQPARQTQHRRCLYTCMNSDVELGCALSHMLNNWDSCNSTQ